MVFRFKASIEGNKIFMREYEIKGITSLYALHLYLQNDLGFAPDQMVLFRVANKKGKKSKEYGLFNFGDGAMDSIKIETLYNQGHTTLEYVYDMFKNRSLKLEILSIEELIHKKSYPRLIAERGKNPDQFSDDYDDFEHMIEPSDNEDLYAIDDND